MLDELRDIVQGKSRFEITQVAGRYPEDPRLGGGAPALQPPAQCLVDDLAERSASALRFRLELGVTSSSRVGVVPCVDSIGDIL